MREAKSIYDENRKKKKQTKDAKRSRERRSSYESCEKCECVSLSLSPPSISTQRLDGVASTLSLSLTKISASLSGPLSGVHPLVPSQREEKNRGSFATRMTGTTFLIFSLHAALPARRARSSHSARLWSASTPFKDPVINLSLFSFFVYYWFFRLSLSLSVCLCAFNLLFPVYLSVTAIHLLIFYSL